MYIRENTMSYVNVFMLPGVTVRVEYQIFEAQHRWDDWDTGYTQPTEDGDVQIPWYGLRESEVGGWLVIDTRPLPGQAMGEVPGYPWNRMRVVIGGLPADYEARVTLLSADNGEPAWSGQQTAVMSELWLGASPYPQPFDFGVPITRVTAVSGSELLQYVLQAPYQFPAICSFLIEINELPPFWTEHVLTSELI